MSLITISEISKDYGISTRTLRYYEEIGLLPSRRCDDYAYRTYDQAAANRLRQILVLKKPPNSFSAVLLLRKNF